MNFIGTQDGAFVRAQVELLSEERNWKGRPVGYVAGSWARVRTLLPEFRLADFRSDGGPANPYYRVVTRLPLHAAESAIPVGLVSHNYALLQHRDLGDYCVEALKGQGFAPDVLRCELGLSELGEWMNLRFELPKEFSFVPSDGHPLALRLEVFNSVDGSSRLIALMSWFRLVCSNGLVVRKTMTELSDKHDRNLDIECIREVISRGLGQAREDRASIDRWGSTAVTEQRLIDWVDGPICDRWGVKAAARVLHICMNGTDVSLMPPFEKCKPSRKTVTATGTVPGAPVPARSLYDVSQALSWVATTRRGAEERITWQADIPDLVGQLAEHP